MNNNALNNEIENNVNNMELNNAVTIEEQNNFFNTIIGKAINTGINLALRVVLPDFIENQVIDIKNVLMEQGLKDGIKTITNSALDVGKSAAGIFTGKFENVSQMENVVKKGGIIDTTSKIFDSVVNTAKNNKLIDNTVATTLKKSKNVILNSIDSSIESTINNQIKSAEKLYKSITNWKKAYEEKDMNVMQKEYNKIKKELKNIMPLENTIKSAHEIENLHNLIKSKGNDFNLSEKEIEMSKKLV